MENRLEHEDSPYLQQHKDNPVDWYPWCDEAFDQAKRENKAIFISIGYSSCHWCHVMEHEVFENETLAEKLNASFICIKVDREERPDIDKYYQEVHMLLNRRPGGWPTSIFSTPENKPFFAGTYIPPVSAQNMLGFGELIGMISKGIEDKDETLFANAEEIQSYLKPADRPKDAAHLNEAMVSTYLKQCEGNFDKEYGGFGAQMKFPQVSMLKGLLDIASLTKDAPALQMCTHTLDQMTRGGMYDLVEGGFCRYSTEKSWLIPHFEKMAYDNGLLSELYLQAYRVTKNKAYLQIAKESLNFMIEKMSQEHLFYSASDADSNGVEGGYFIYDYEEVIAVFEQNGITSDEAKVLCVSLSISPKGNFEGSNIVRLTGEKHPAYEKAIHLLSEIRAQREYPFIDKKVNAAWSAMVIKSLYLLSHYEEGFRQEAELCLDALLNKLYCNGQLYHTAMINGDVKVEGFLEDYAYLSLALIQAYQTTLNTEYLLRAQRLCDKALELFFEGGRWYFSKAELLVEADISDSSYPGSVGVIVDALLSLGVLVDEKYRRFAFMSLEYYSSQLVKKPVHFPYLFTQALRFIKEDRVIKGSKAALEELNADYIGLDYPYLLRSISESEETLLCGVQSCFAKIEAASDLREELRKTL
jgi:hypothetical protein